MSDDHPSLLPAHIGAIELNLGPLMTSFKGIMFCTANCFSVSKHYSKSEGYVICFLLISLAFILLRHLQCMDVWL